MYARERWNDPGLYLQPGRDRFEAVGEWVDKSITCGPAGTRDGNFQFGEIIHVASTAWGWLERGWQRVTGNDGADFVATRRLEREPWFCLIGAVANDAGGQPGTDGSPNPHQQFAIGERVEQQLDAGGYFYAFANDAWDFYGNNRGSVTLTIARIG